MSDMPMEIWAKDFDAPQYKGEFFKYEPNDVRAGKYHRDDKYRALEAENEKLRGSLALIASKPLGGVLQDYICARQLQNIARDALEVK